MEQEITKRAEREFDSKLKQLDMEIQMKCKIAETEREVKESEARAKEFKAKTKYAQAEAKRLEAETKNMAAKATYAKGPNANSNIKNRNHTYYYRLVARLLPQH